MAIGGVFLFYLNIKNLVGAGEGYETAIKKKVTHKFRWTEAKPMMGRAE